MATKQGTTQGTNDDKRERQNQENAQIIRRSAGWPFGTESNVLGPRDIYHASPFHWMRRMSEEMDRVFGGFGFGRDQGEGFAWSPALEVVEREGRYVVRAELAGLKPEEVKVEVTDGTLVVQGERKSDYDEKQGGYRRSEHRYGRFYRSVALPEGTDPGQVRARFENGMLQVTFPVPQQRQSDRRQIPIEGASGATKTNPTPEPHG